MTSYGIEVEGNSFRHRLLLEQRNSLLVGRDLLQTAKASKDGQLHSDKLSISLYTRTIKALLNTFVQIDHVGRSLLLAPATGD